MKQGTCHAEPVRSTSNGPERSEGAQGKLREGSALFVFNKKKQMLRCAHSKVIQPPCHSEQLQRRLAAVGYVTETTGVAHVVSGEECSDEKPLFREEH